MVIKGQNIVRLNLKYVSSFHSAITKSILKSNYNFFRILFNGYQLNFNLLINVLITLLALQIWSLVNYENMIFINKRIKIIIPIIIKTAKPQFIILYLLDKNITFEIN